MSGSLSSDSQQDGNLDPSLTWDQHLEPREGSKTYPNPLDRTPTEIPSNLTVIILQWGSSGETARCLDALEKSTGPSLDILVVDNGSPPKDISAIRNRRSPPKILENRINLGFAEGNNRALRSLLSDWRSGLSSPYVLLLNNDLEVEPGAIEEMLTVMRKTGAAAVGAMNRIRGRSELTSCGGFVDWPSGTYRDIGPEASSNPGRFQEVETLCGSTLLLDLKAINSVGLFDPGFFCVYEETDLCLRLKAAGYQLMLATRAWTDHAVGGSTDRKVHFYFRFRNRIHLTHKHRGNRGLLGLAIPQLWEVALRTAAYLVTGRIENICGIVRGTWDGIRGIQGKGPYL